MKGEGRVLPARRPADPPENATTAHGVGIQADSRGGGARRQNQQDLTTPRNFYYTLGVYKCSIEAHTYRIRIKKFVACVCICIYTLPEPRPPYNGGRKCHVLRSTSII